MHNNNNFKHHGEKTKNFLGRHNLIFPHTMNIYSSRAPLFRCFFKLGSTTLKAEQPLKRMVLQKKNKKKKMDSIQESCFCIILRKLDLKIHHSKIIMKLEKKLYDPFFMNGVHLSQGYRATMRKQFTFYHSVLRSSWYSTDQLRKDERLS